MERRNVSKENPPVGAGQRDNREKEIEFALCLIDYLCVWMYSVIGS